MAAPSNMVTPTLFSLGDLAKEDNQMIIILHTVQFCSAHVAISISQVGVHIRTLFVVRFSASNLNITGL
jgi:hypothetical protein